MKKILYLFLVFSLVACGGEDEPTVKPEKKNMSPIPKEFYQSAQSIESFFVEQLDKEKTSNPKDSMYREYITQENVSTTSQAMWELWKKANAERIEKADMKATEYGSMATWNIPQQEKMKTKFFSKGEKPATKYPMIIHLHGGGGYPNVESAWASSINEDEWYNTMALARDYNDAPSFCAVPRMADDRKGSWYFTPQIQTYKKMIQIAFLKEIISTEKICITGISQGGYGTLRLAQFMPDYFSAVGVVAASEKPQEQSVNLRNVAFRMRVGENDSKYGRNVHAYQWQDKLIEMQNANPNDYVGQVIIQENADHTEVDYMNTTPWLVKQKRRHYPKHLTYVYHNIAPAVAQISGAYSTGVYYLDFRQLTTNSNKASMLFDVVKNGNTFAITTKKITDKVNGKLTIYLDKIDFNQPVEIKLNSKRVHFEKHRPSRGVMVESIALFGDPTRIFSAKITIEV